MELMCPWRFQHDGRMAVVGKLEAAELVSREQRGPCESLPVHGGLAKMGGDS